MKAPMNARVSESTCNQDLSVCKRRHYSTCIPSKAIRGYVTEGGILRAVQLCRIQKIPSGMHLMLIHAYNQDIAIF